MRQETMVYVGLDVHKEFCQAAVIDDSGRVLSNERFSSTRDELNEFLDRFEDAKFVLESTGIWEFIYEGIERRGFDVELAHPLKVRAIAEAKVKTDKVDAETLAQLLRASLIPRSWVPSRNVRDLRQLVRQRAYLVQQSTSLKNRIHAGLLRRGVRRPEKLKEPFSFKSIDWMRSLGIPTVDSCLNCLENVQAQIEDINTQLLDEYNRRPDAQLISTIPGIGFYSALLILAEIDDIRRFPRPENLCAYAGLVPTVRQSASSVHYGAISKDGSSYLRWMLTEAVHTHTRCEPDSRLSRFHAKVARRRGKQKAIVATARKLLLIIYWMLRTKEPYHCQGFNPVFPPARTSAT
jgi:transposase